MKLKNCITVLFVKNIDSSRKFYTDILGLEILLDFGKNIIFSCGIAIWEIREDHIIPTELGIEKVTDRSHNRSELYFETETIEMDFKQLKEKSISFLHEIHEELWGQRTFRFFDPDNHLVEIGETMEQLVLRLHETGMDEAAINKKTSVPVDEIIGILNL